MQEKVHVILGGWWIPSNVLVCFALCRVGYVGSNMNMGAKKDLYEQGSSSVQKDGIRIQR